MNLIDKTSLARTLDAISEHFFFERPIAAAARKKAAQWIVSRCGLNRSYAGMPAPTEKDFAEGARVFTGEQCTSGAGTAHILGEEACRALILLRAYPNN